MTVYVDDLYLHPMGQLGQMKMSHLVADTEEELHAMADKIGVARRWFQQKPSGDHYDVALVKRSLAIRHGAVAVTVRTLALMCSNRRQTGELGDPTTAHAVWARLRNDKRGSFIR